MTNTIRDIKIIPIPEHVGEGNLYFLENKDLPFTINRIFYVTDAPRNTFRGKHAHRECEQLLICISGDIQVVCTDGVDEATFELNHPNSSLYIPAGIWATQKYHSRTTSLMVLASHNYEESDYIREYQDYIDYRAELAK